MISEIIVLIVEYKNILKRKVPKNVPLKKGGVEALWNDPMTPIPNPLIPITPIVDPMNLIPMTPIPNPQISITPTFCLIPIRGLNLMVFDAQMATRWTLPVVRNVLLKG
jgi:hypothetical protein